MRAVPLVADDVPVDVVYEDQHLVAVNKPAGVCTAPRHRFEVGVLDGVLLGRGNVILGTTLGHNKTPELSA